MTAEEMFIKLGFTKKNNTKHSYNVWMRKYYYITRYCV